MLPGVWPRRWIDLEGLLADADGVAVLDRAGDGDRQVGGVGRVRDRLGAGRLDDLGERAVVVPVAVRRDDGADPAVPDQPQDRLRLGGRVDQQALAGGRVAQQVDVVGHLADRELADRQARQFADVGRAAGLDVAGVARSFEGSDRCLSLVTVTVQAWTLAEVSTLLIASVTSSVCPPWRSPNGCVPAR